MEIETLRAMNSEIVLVAETDPSQAEAGFAVVRNFIAASERCFTCFSDLVVAASQ